MGFIDRIAFWRNSNDFFDLGIKAAAAELTQARLPRPPAPSTSKYSLERYAKRSELVYACVEKKAASACDPTIVVEKQVITDGKEGWEKVLDHPLVSLMNNPNPYETSDSFMRAWMASENLTDVFYAEIVRSRAKKPVGLYPLHPGDRDWETNG